MKRQLPVENLRKHHRRTAFLLDGMQQKAFEDGIRNLELTAADLTAGLSRRRRLDLDAGISPAPCPFRSAPPGPLTGSPFLAAGLVRTSIPPAMPIFPAMLVKLLDQSIESNGCCTRWRMLYDGQVTAARLENLR